MVTTKIDLHVHTTASDGKLTPEDIVKLAKKKDYRLSPSPTMIVSEERRQRLK